MPISKIKQGVIAQKEVAKLRVFCRIHCAIKHKVMHLQLVKKEMQSGKGFIQKIC